MYEKRELIEQIEQVVVAPVNPSSGGAAAAGSTTAPVFRLIIGLDTPPGVVMTDELDVLADPFAALVLRRGDRPMSADNTVSLLEERSTDAPQDVAVPMMRSFIVGEGGQIPFSDATAKLARALRFVIVMTGAGTTSNGPILMFSIDDRPQAPDGLLQILGWDEQKRAYNFYQRREGNWFYAGDSFDALRPPTRGRGPFDGHVNGSLVMKELRRPWIHWSSMAVGVPAEAFPPNHPMRTHAFFVDAKPAELLESEIIVPGIKQFTQSRLDRAIDGGRLGWAHTFMRQVLTTTAVNIVSSFNEYALIDDDTDVVVPLEIMLNAEFWNSAEMLDRLTIRGRTHISGKLYNEALKTFAVELRDEASNFRRPGDSFFAYACPAPAFEDLDVIFALIDRGVLSRRFLRALVAVDFQNPIQSTRRAALMRYFPDAGEIGSSRGSIEAIALASMAEVASADPSSPEFEVVARMNADEAAARTQLSEEIAAYVEMVRNRLKTPEGALDLMGLVDSRRRYFRTLGASEFSLTLPFSKIPEHDPFLEMRRDGTAHAATPLIS